MLYWAGWYAGGYANCPFVLLHAWKLSLADLYLFIYLFIFLGGGYLCNLPALLDLFIFMYLFMYEYFYLLPEVHLTGAMLEI